MNLRHMKIFVVVCQENSITIASKKMYISQPAISTAIKEMENYYGVKLFDRLSKKIYLTEVGKVVLSYALHITSLFDELETTIRNSDTIGTLRIGSSFTIGTHLMPKYIKQFSSKYPSIQTFVTINNSDIIENLVIDNKLDFALIEGLVHSENLISKSFFNDELVVVCSLSNPLLKKHSVSIKDLKTQDFLMREKNSGTRELADSILLLHGFSVLPIWESASTDAILSGVASGIGISILPLLLVQNYIDDGVIGKLNVIDINLKRQFYIIYHKNKFLTPSSLEFLKLCRE
ncbi:LysR family transcriptional regulator [Clostridium lacusfryxellense]|uniref:LysR family transcriptional regulator n=1 Tax=Clostridium lacusfryxellense TaxID=205328 RepID=UPI001C0D5ED8|nr:LysR family transcriptional regulator [Clostridium lacusfryxellense]MBU3113462.1 LysR family transcriptional regulator [Clostridium lacusfryxellense]